MREQFELRTIRTHDGTILAILVGRTVGLMMSRTRAQQVRRVLGRECGPVFTDSGDTSVFLTNSPAAGIDIPETTLELYRTYGVMALAHPGLLARCTESTVPESTTAHHSLVDGYARFLGEVLVHSLDGQWFHDPAPSNSESVRATILFPYTASRVHVTDWVHRALHARTCWQS